MEFRADRRSAAAIVQGGEKLAKRKGKMTMNRSAITGRFVSDSAAARHPRTTVRETVSRPKGKRK
jgi:hypothetical protein